MNPSCVDRLAVAVDLVRDVERAVAGEADLQTTATRSTAPPTTCTPSAREPSGSVVDRNRERLRRQVARIDKSHRGGSGQASARTSRHVSRGVSESSRSRSRRRASPRGAPRPSSTWKEWPQPHDEAAFGLSILKPGLLQAGQEVDRGALEVRDAEGIDDDVDALEHELVGRPRPPACRTRARTGSRSSRRPGSRRASTIVSPSGSSAISSRIFAAAAGVIVSRVGRSLGRSVISMPSS